MRLTPIARCATMCLALATASCVRYARAELEDGARFELLHARELSAFEQRLATERQVGLDDVWTRAGEAWLALAQCQPVAEVPATGDPHARLLIASLRLEQARRARLLLHQATGLRRAGVAGTLLAQLDDDTFFARDAAPPPEGLVLWPAAEEAWADELPAAITLTSQCAAQREALTKLGASERAAWDADERVWAAARQAPQPDTLDAAPPRHQLNLTPDADPLQLRPETVAWWQREELERADAVLTIGEQLTETERAPAAIDALLWRVRFHRGALIGELGAQLAELVRPTPREVALAEAWRDQLIEVMLPLAERELEAGAPEVAVSGELRAVALLIGASAWSARQEYGRALEAYARAEQIGVSSQEQWPARYARLRLLSSLARWEDALAMSALVPEPSSPYYAPYLYRVAYAARRLGQTDRFLGLAMQAFRDRPYRADPFMRALYMQLLYVLSDYPFELRVVEVLEDMGQRSLIFERVEEYATVALDRGQPENARAAARWLLGKQVNVSFHPRYHALLALASFLEDDEAQFSEALARVVARPAQLLSAVPAARQPAFFAGADAQLARVLRQMLPIMAEWGEGAQASARRQRWLGILITHAQQFVRASPESLARPSLVELYRIASAMLDEDQPRAYPERVGQGGPTPLVLGTVRVEDRDLAPYEPTSMTFKVPQLPSLTLVPRDVVGVGQWAPRWGVGVDGAPLTADAGGGT